jgi:hypothetical protein
MFSLEQPVGWDCLIVGLLLLGVFDFWVLINVGRSLDKVTMPTIEPF